MAVMVGLLWLMIGLVLLGGGSEEATERQKATEEDGKDVERAN